MTATHLNDKNANFQNAILKNDDLEDAVFLTVCATLLGATFAVTKAWSERKEYLAESLRRLNLSPNTIWGYHKRHTLLGRYMALAFLSGSFRFGFPVACIAFSDVLLSRIRKQRDIWNPILSSTVVGFLYGLPFGVRKVLYITTFSTAFGCLFGLIQNFKRRFQKTFSELETKESQPKLSE